MTQKNTLKFFVFFVAGLFFNACASTTPAHISGDLSELSKKRTVAILPVEVSVEGHHDAGVLLRKSLHANFKSAGFDIMERYVIDGLLQKKGYTKAADFNAVSPVSLGETLGADLIIRSRLNEVSRSYWVLHSSIEIDVSIEVTDANTGEIVWDARQSESDFEGLFKVPTGITSAVWGPLQFVTNKTNLHRMTKSLVAELTRPRKNSPMKEDMGNVATILAANKPEPSIKIRTDRGLVTQNSARPLWETDFNPKQKITSSPRNQFPSDVRPVSFSSEVKPYYTVETENLPDIKPRRFMLMKKPNFMANALPENSFLYTLQVGAFKTKAYAERLFRQMMDKGYKAFMTLFKTDEDPIYRVQVEKFGDKKTAEDYSKEFTDKEHLNIFVTQIETPVTRTEIRRF